MKTNSKLVFILYGVIVLLLVGGAYLLYKNAQLNKGFVQERSEMQAMVRKNQLQNDRQQLTFGMKTFAWAVRNCTAAKQTGGDKRVLQYPGERPGHQRDAAGRG